MYYLISQVQVYLPPLRNRKNDLLDIANEILKDELKKRELPMKEYSNKSIENIIEYNWPNNIKEMRTEIRKAILRSYNAEEIHMHLNVREREIIANKNKALFKLIHSAIELHDTSINYDNHIEIIRDYFKTKKNTQAS